MMEQFDEADCYTLFTAVDSSVRQLTKPSAELLALRERLLPYYRARHRSDLAIVDATTG